MKFLYKANGGPITPTDNTRVEKRTFKFKKPTVIDDGRFNNELSTNKTGSKAIQESAQIIENKKELNKNIDKKQDIVNNIALASTPIPVLGEIVGAGSAIANGVVDIAQGQYSNAALDLLPYSVSKGVKYGKETLRINDLKNPSKWYNQQHSGTLQNTGYSDNAEYIGRGVANEEAVHDFLNSGILRSRKSAGLKLDKRGENYGEKVYLGDYKSGLMGYPTNNYTFKVKNSPDLKHRPVMADDVEDVLMKTNKGYVSYPDWKTKVKRFKYGGGLTKNIGNTDMSVQSITGSASGVLDALDAGNDLGFQSAGTTIGKSALQGASLGMSFGPIGAAIGGVAGGALGLINANKDAAEQVRIRKTKTDQEKNLALNATRAMSVNNPYAFSGQKVNMYKFGGLLKFKNGARKMALGGYLKPLNSTDHLVVGKSHDRGGVKFPEHNVELEGKETKSGNFIFSHALGFAKQSLPLMKAKGKIEKHLQQNPLDGTAQNTISLLDDNLSQLAHKQESVKAMLGMDNDMIKKQTGGPVNPKNAVHKSFIDYTNRLNRRTDRRNRLAEPIEAKADGKFSAAPRLLDDGSTKGLFPSATTFTPVAKNPTVYKPKPKITRTASTNKSVVGAAVASNNVIPNIARPTIPTVNVNPINRISKASSVDSYDLGSDEKNYSSIVPSKKNTTQILPFVSNAINAVRRYPSPNAPVLASAEQTPLVDLSAKKAILDNEIRGKERSLDGLSTNMRMSLKGNLLDKSITGRNELTATEQGLNTEINGRNAQARQQIGLYNNGLTNQYNQDLTEFKLAKGQASQANLSDAVDKAVQIKQDNIDERNITKRLKILTTPFSKAVGNEEKSRLNALGVDDYNEILGIEPKKKADKKLKFGGSSKYAISKTYN